MSNDQPIWEAVCAVLEALPCSVTFPAGAGKTELIAAAAAEVAARGGSSLVLTHTNAGVDALRRRMRKFGVPRDQGVVRTIDSWSYDLIAHFPTLAQLAVPVTPDWAKAADYHRAAAQAVMTDAVRRMLRVSYTNLFIDEYQDCLTDQHDLAVALSDVVPTAVMGDPLQSLFNFGDNRPVDWTDDVVASFPSISLEHRPYRWHPNHKDLGVWLVGIRDDLLRERPIDLTGSPVRWVRRQDPQTFVTTCYHALKFDGTVAALGRFRTDCVNAAGRLGGTYAVMEAIDERTTLDLATKIDTKSGAEVAHALVEFAVRSTAGLASHIPSAKRKRLADGNSFSTTKDELKPAYEGILQLRNSPAPREAREVLGLLSRLPGVSIHCREAWNELARALATASTDDCTVSEAIQRERNHTRMVGRRPRAHVVSRPLLVKGLEYDHVILMDPTNYSAQELYVALTRGSKSVTVISDRPLLPVAKMAAPVSESPG